MSHSSALQSYFAGFRQYIIGNGQTFESPFGLKEIIYADWTASGRAYLPIEECIQNEVMPFVANTHTETSITSTLMSKAYEQAKVIVKQHVNANDNDALIFCGSGMTAAVNKLQKILGLRVPERLMDYVKTGCQSTGTPSQLLNDHLQIDELLRPVIFVTHMEHHSNQVSWEDTIATVQIIRSDANGNIDLEHFKALLEKFKKRKNKIAAITACSNVTGIQTLYHAVAKLIHEYGGWCFVDFACSAPYVNMDMHPAEKGTHLDAIYFSPHKFLGGPGTPGVLIFNKILYKNSIPDQPGGGTILYSNPWNQHEYINDIEQREDGGTPPILQGIKAAMCIRLKEEMGIENLVKREEELLHIVFGRFAAMKNVNVLGNKAKKRLGVVSFIVHGAPHNLIAKLLNDRFGVQVRAGCSCAGTYGHLLFNIGQKRSHEILDQIRFGDLSSKPGWIRLSVHPTMTDAEIEFMMEAIEQTALNYEGWATDYIYDPQSNEYVFKGYNGGEDTIINNWLNVAAKACALSTL